MVCSEGVSGSCTPPVLSVVSTAREATMPRENKRTFFAFNPIFCDTQLKNVNPELELRCTLYWAIYKKRKTKKKQKKSTISELKVS